ncbi:MAG: hypothetical protein AAF125_22585, partial [Chloroflexota bacterium]
YPQDAAPQAEAATTTDFCDVASGPPVSVASWDATGSLILTSPTSQLGIPYRVEMETGSLSLDDTLPRCYVDGSCNTSPSGAWQYEIVSGMTARDVLLRATDGGEVRSLLPEDEVVFDDLSAFWRLGTDILEIRYNRFEFGQSEGRTTRFVRTYDPNTGQLSDAVELASSPGLAINELPTQVLAVQPVARDWVLASVPFGPEHLPGNTRFYLVNEAAGIVDYFARPAGPDGLQYQWRPDGKAFYYTEPGTGTWYAFDTDTAQHRIETAQHRLLGSLPGRVWSRDARLRAGTYTAEPVEAAQRRTAGIPLLRFAVWDADTDALRRYCLDGLASLNDGALVWSPDGRYITFSGTLRESLFDTRPTPIPDTTPTPIYGLVSTEPQYQAGQPRLLVLDVMTGELAQVATGDYIPVNWTEATP